MSESNVVNLESARLNALERLHIVNSGYEQPFDRIVRMVADFFNVPNVGIHLLDDATQWVKAFAGEQFACPRDQSVCQFILETNQLMVIPDLREDERTRNLAIVTGAPHLRFYAGMPLITSDGYTIGTVCLIDMQPRGKLSAPQQKLFQEFAALITEVMELRVRYQRTEQALHTATDFDAATGLPNRATVIREGQRLLDNAGPQAATAVIKVRLDRMSLVLRTFGQQGGLTVVRTVAQRLSNLLGPDVYLGRGDGNNFILIHIGRQSEDSITLNNWLDDKANQVLAAIARPIVIGTQKANITASLGLALMNHHSAVYHVVDAASAASLGSRELGGNQARRFSAEEFSAFRERISIETELREAAIEKAFLLHYQPIVDIAEQGKVVGAEALIRWPREDKLPIGPDRFIPVAEEIGIIHELGLWVFNTACRDLASWQQHDQALWISVNLSPVQLSDPLLADKLVARAQQSGIACSQIKLEITEGALETHFTDVNQTLNKLHQAGFTLAIDDFGTGHSSMNRVIRLPFDSLKVDRGFVSDCPDGAGAAVVSSMASLASQLNMDLIAEGVETEQQEQFLLQLGYRLAQGYRYARPMSAEALTRYLLSSYL
ncbi:EAL domain-containing protein [Arsukibacterium sp.]|uniref:sensor domain-containing phosphodiesterase n=1 Tax=Arsukibacterium sp. TaxID=1977258 RepID=UPI001BD52E63|nr:EAL domain-containing protein [Arsukibacterium sp.]